MIALFLPMPTNNFIIEIPCKPYVKVYIENECGAPADLTNLPDLLLELKNGLRRKISHRETEAQAKCCCLVKVIIPNDLFYRYGWEVNRESMMDFNRIAEKQVKFLMRQYISLNNALGASLTDCIRNFQNDYGFPEQIWSFDTIKKDFYRNRGIKYKTLSVLREEMNKIFVAEMSRMGTLRRRFKKQECNG
jgi:hypothetical protein